MKNWISNNITAIISVIVTILIAISSFSISQYALLIRHDEKIIRLREDGQDNERAFSEMRTDISQIKEAVFKMAGYIDQKKQER